MTTAEPRTSVTAETFDAAVLGVERPVLVNFTDSGCGHCESMTLRLRPLAAEYAGRVDVLSVDARRNPELARRYDVLGLPVFVLFHRGREMGRLAGLPTRAALRQLLDSPA